MKFWLKAYETLECVAHAILCMVVIKTVIACTVTIYHAYILHSAIQLLPLIKKRCWLETSVNIKHKKCYVDNKNTVIAHSLQLHFRSNTSSTYISYCSPIWQCQVLKESSKLLTLKFSSNYWQRFNFNETLTSTTELS